jgi:hypothetical protein
MTAGKTRHMGMRRPALVVIAALIAAGCSQAKPHGTVNGTFNLPGRSASDLQRGGLNFSIGAHGNGRGHTTAVAADGSYTVTLPPGSYSVIGALAGHPGGPAPESCAETMNIVVRAKATTRADYVCHATPMNSPKP